MFHGSEPRLSVEEGPDTATCHMAPDPASLLRRAPTLSCARSFRPSLPIEEGSSAAICPVAPASTSLMRRAPVLSRVSWVSTCP
jgi:hypothetical protein